MTKRNPDYDFKWCPGCGDFGVLRGLEKALEERCEALNEPIEKSWSCYKGEKYPCGICDSCRIRDKSLRQANRADLCVVER